MRRPRITSYNVCYTKLLRDEPGKDRKMSIARQLLEVLVAVHGQGAQATESAAQEAREDQHALGVDSYNFV